MERYINVKLTFCCSEKELGFESKWAKIKTCIIYSTDGSILHWMIPSNFREKENKVAINIKKVAKLIKHMTHGEKKTQWRFCKKLFSWLTYQITISQILAEVPSALINNASSHSFRYENKKKLTISKIQSSNTFLLWNIKPDEKICGGERSRLCAKAKNTFVEDWE